ncbi:hypothetical protein SEA_GALACTICA_94 [Streptomyces phage Galactica]|nr:hypothetical protein SEA_GALACTICA_94 [Streptomyces phage Galactica]
MIYWCQKVGERPRPTGTEEPKMANIVAKLLELDHAAEQARGTLRTAKADVTKDTARNTIRQAQSEHADLLENATDAEFAEYIAQRNRH